MSEISLIADRLKQTGVTVPNAWLSDCVAFVTQQWRAKNRPVTTDSVFNGVFAQWLEFDLNELNFATLPPGINVAKKTVLSGTFCLQIDRIWDVGTPSYTQYRKLTGTENANVEVTTSDNQTQNFWEPKPKRMLMMELSDGVQMLKAMEYHPIAQLSISTPPGTKVKLIGTIQCRSGVLLLSNGDLNVLGGKVDRLVETNSTVKLLAAKLNITDALPQTCVKAEMNEPISQDNNGVNEEESDDEDAMMAQMDLDNFVNESLNTNKSEDPIIDLT